MNTQFETLRVVAPIPMRNLSNLSDENDDQHWIHGPSRDGAYIQPPMTPRNQDHFIPEEPSTPLAENTHPNKFVLPPLPKKLHNQESGAFFSKQEIAKFMEKENPCDCFLPGPEFDQDCQLGEVVSHPITLKPRKIPMGSNSLFDWDEEIAWTLQQEEERSRRKTSISSAAQVLSSNISGCVGDMKGDGFVSVPTNSLVGRASSFLGWIEHRQSEGLNPIISIVYTFTSKENGGMQKVFRKGFSKHTTMYRTLDKSFKTAHKELQALKKTMPGNLKQDLELGWIVAVAEMPAFAQKSCQSDHVWRIRDRAESARYLPLVCYDQSLTEPTASDVRMNLIPMLRGELQEVFSNFLQVEWPMLHAVVPRPSKRSNSERPRCPPKPETPVQRPRVNRPSMAFPLPAFPTAA